MAKERIGIMGGSFNPIHRRHVEMAEYALREAKLDRVVFLPTGNPPHKREGLAPAEHRYQMASLAVCGKSSFSVSRVELERTGTIYTFDTLTLLKKQLPDAEFFYIIGDDTLLDLPNWYKPDKVFPLCRFLVFSREEKDIAHHPVTFSLTARGARFTFLPLPAEDISATAVREKLASGEETPELCPQVEEYIRVCGLYGQTASPAGGEKMLCKLSAALNPRRFCHTVLVCYTARKLARLHGVDENQAVTAALLHDCAKCLPLAQMQKIAREHRLLVDSETMASPLLHGPVGAVLAETEYGVTDPGVLSAIRCHTTGKVGMLPLDMVVYLADKIEPSRRNYEGLQETRTLAQKSLIAAMRYNASHFVEGASIRLHPTTQKMVDWLKRLPD